MSLTCLFMATGPACRQAERAAADSRNVSKSEVGSEPAVPADHAETEAMADPASNADSASGRSENQGMSQLESGIEGRVVIGPTCPVLEQNRPCPDQPYETELTIRRAASGAVAAVVNSDAEGYFRIDLPPGAYVVDPGVPRLVTEPRAEPVAVEVRAGRYAKVAVRYDSGVR